MATRLRAAPLSAYVLHRYAWSESSLIVDLFTREQGRLAVAAKGARKPFSQLRAVLLPFQPLHASLGREPPEGDAREVHTLRGAEWVGGHAMPKGSALFSGFYLNELLMKLLARHDPHPRLFDVYARTIGQLAGDGDGLAGQAALRAFEIALLREIGLLPDLAVETASRQPVDPRARYAVLADAGVARVDFAAEEHGDAGRPATDAGGTPTAAGSTLLAIQAALDTSDLARLQVAAADALGELRPLLRTQLHYHLGTTRLRTRQVMIDAQALDRAPLPAAAGTLPR